MYEALMEIIEPQLILRDKTKLEEGWLQGRQEGHQEGLQKGIHGTVDALRKFGIKNTDIKAAIIENYGLSEEKAEKYL